MGFAALLRRRCAARLANDMRRQRMAPLKALKSLVKFI
jgi:hypothetical protein